MNKLIILILLVSCAHQKKPGKVDEDLVTLNTALMQAQASYLKGCVDALKEIGVPLAFTGCRDKSILHRRELDSIMDQEL